jgi:N-methylhydantoinase A
LPAGHFLGGTIPLDIHRAFQTIQTLGDMVGLNAHATALGIIEVVNANMERALHLISVERGYDPQDFTLLSYGGAGGLHASDLAHRLGVPCIMIPPYAATLSAYGMLASNLIKDYSITVMKPGNTPLDTIMLEFAPLVERCLYEMEAEGIRSSEILLEYSLDVRYRGQAYELTIPLGDDILADFHSAHLAAYGYNRTKTAVEIVNLRLRAVSVLPTPELHPLPDGGKDPKDSIIEFHPVVFYSGSFNTPLYRGESLLPGNELHGPALIIRKDTTILLNRGDVGTLDRYGNLWIQVPK